MTTNSSLSYIQWLSKLIHCHKNSSSECPVQTNFVGGDDKNRHTAKTNNNGIENKNIIMKRREAVTEATEGQQNPFAGREYIKKMPYSSPQNFMLSDSPQGSQTSCDDIVPPPKNCYRLVVLGSARVGKTCIVSRFLGGKFDDSYTPTIEDFHRKLYRIRGEVYQLDLLDTSGNHPFPAMRRLSFLTGDMFVIVFSMDCRESWEEAIHLREQILETKLNATASTGSSSGWTVSLTGASRKRTVLKVPMVLAGNKCDSEIRTVTSEEASAYCSTQDNCCVFVECSAKKNLHIDDVFYELFLAANLPLEMAPNHHKRISVGFGAPCPLPPSVPTHPSKKYTLSIKRRLSDACGVVAPNVRRPSIRTDLMIMRTKTCSLGDSDGSNSRQGQSWSRCVIQ